MRVGGVSVSDGLRGATLFRSVGRPPGGILAKAAHVARRRDGISRHALCLFCPVATHRRVSGSMAPDTHGLFASRALSDRRAGDAPARNTRMWRGVTPGEHIFPDAKNSHECSFMNLMHV